MWGSPILLEIASTKNLLSFQYRDELTSKHSNIIGRFDCLSLPLIVFEMRQSSSVRGFFRHLWCFYPLQRFLPSSITVPSRRQIPFKFSYLSLNSFQMYLPCFFPIFLLQCSPSLSKGASISVKYLYHIDSHLVWYLHIAPQIQKAVKIWKIDFSEILPLQNKLYDLLNTSKPFMVSLLLHKIYYQHLFSGHETWDTL